MTPEIKFCGVTRAEDARASARLGVAYVGVIFAGGPRQVSADHAASVFAAASGSVRRVGVFGAADIGDIVRIAREVELDVVQLHGERDTSRVEPLRSNFGGLVWLALRLGADGIPSHAAAAFQTADAVLIEASAPGKLGGTATRLDWKAVANALARIRGVTPLVLAGGLDAECVGEAIAALDPQIVDVSSGIESALGIKDPDRMRAFVTAVQAVASDHGR